MTDQRRREAAILAGLRSLQAMRACRTDRETTESIEDVASSGGEFEAMDDSEIDALCEDINLGAVAIVGKIRG